MGINSRQDIAGYRLARVINEATSTADDGSVRIDPIKFKTLFNGPNNEMLDSNKILYGAANGTTQNNIQQFVKNIEATQLKSARSFSKTARYIMLRVDGFVLPLTFLHSALSGNLPEAASAAGIAGLQLGAAGLAKLLTSPKTARLMLNMANGSALGVSDNYAARVIIQTLAGTTNALVHADGGKSNIQVQPGGQVSPLNQ